jgi:two-component system chemotaxis response regulator CheY
LYHIQIIDPLDTGALIVFDFNTRLNTARFGALRDESFFQSVTTDGDYLVFEKKGFAKVSIPATDLMDLVLLDRTRSAGRRWEE